MKVAALLPDYIDKPMGGLGEQFKNLYTHLKDRVDYYIVGLPETPKVKHFKPVMIPFRNFYQPTINNVYQQLIYYHNALEYGVEFDVIHSFDWSTALAGVYLARHYKKPLLYGMNLSALELNKSGTFFADTQSWDGSHLNYFLLCCEELGLTYANRITNVSRYYEDLFPAFKKKSVIIPNGLNTSEWVVRRAPNLPGKNKIKVCYIGRACDMKGIDMITESNIPDTIDLYFVAGFKGAEQKIWNLIKEKVNNRNIFHIEGLYGQDKIDFLFAMDAVIMLSKHEPAGIVAMEALISNNVLITTATGGIAETLEGVDYFKCTNSQELQECLEELLKLSDSDLARLKAAGHYKMLKRDWKYSADRLYTLYKELLWEPLLPDHSRSLEETMEAIEKSKTFSY